LSTARAALVRTLLARTHRRSYAGSVRRAELHIGYERGLRGMPKVPGLSPRIRDNAQAVALGEVALALARPDVLERSSAETRRVLEPRMRAGRASAN
jgi:hypothetical protein